MTAPNAGIPIPMQAGAMPQPIVAPNPSQNRVEAVGQRSAKDVAQKLVEQHKKGLLARRQRDLTAEKLLLHIDGSGDFQWADIFHGARVEIPRLVSEYRKTENLLRPIVDNAVAHHTTMPLRFFADSSPDRKARDKAIVDMVWANYLAEQQDFNALAADALYMAMPAGFCPLHAYWREDAYDEYEPIKYGEQQQQGPQRGMIDCFVGNPFDHVFDRTAKRGSIYWQSYGRLLPASLVRQAFADVPGIADLQGSIRIPSASIYQRIARDWRVSELGTHGTSVVDLGRGYQEGEEEMLTLLCREVAPGLEPDWPDGRLQIVAVPGEVDFRRNQGNPSHALLLADQALPAKDFSSSIIYSHHRGDDVLGKPWAEDPDQLQVDLNIALSKRWEHVMKMTEAPIVGPGGALGEDMLDIGGYNYMELEPSLAQWRPRVMEWPESIITALTTEANEKRQAMYTIGGYQAASRGEAPGSRTAYRAIVALQQADSSIHGPVNLRFRRTMTEFMQRCWKQMKTYGDVPWLIDKVGDDYAYLVDPYISNAHLSDTPPDYKLVNAFGASPELRGQEVLDLMRVKGADGGIFLTTEEAKKNYPNQTLFDSQGNPKAVQKRRARTIATAFITFADQLRGKAGIDRSTLTDPSDPKVQQAALWVFGQIETKYPRLRDDDLMAHLSTLSEITQDETADPIARLAAMKRQDLYFQWQAQMAGPQQLGKPPLVTIAMKGAQLSPQQTQEILAQEGVQAPPSVVPGAPGAAPGAPPAPAGVTKVVPAPIHPPQPAIARPGVTHTPAPAVNHLAVATGQLAGQPVHTPGAGPSPAPHSPTLPPAAPK